MVDGADAVVVIGIVLVFLGLGMAQFVVIQNNYAGATITVEADQKLVSTGLYGLVRHPMYVGTLVMMLGTPLALDSYWGLVLAFVPGAADLRGPHHRRGEGAARGTRRLPGVHAEGALPVGARVW